jgi:hypothetical protein
LAGQLFPANAEHPPPAPNAFDDEKRVTIRPAVAMTREKRIRRFILGDSCFNLFLPVGKYEKTG